MPFNSPTMKTAEEKLIQRKLDTVANEIREYHHQEHTRNSYAAESKKEKNSKELQELLDYQQRLEAQFKEYRAEQQVAAAKSPWVETLKDIGKAIGNGFTNLAHSLGIQGIGFGMFTRAVGSDAGWGAFFFNVLAAPLFLAAAAVDALADIYQTWSDDQVKQRKTRYTAGLITLGLFAIGMAVVAGSLTVLAAPIAFPLIFIGVALTASFKFDYLQKQLQKEIDVEKETINVKAAELRNAISVALKKNAGKATVVGLVAQIKESTEALRLFELSTQPTAPILAAAEKSKLESLQLQLSAELHNDPRVQRLSFQLQECEQRLAMLSFKQAHYNTNKNAARAMTFGAGILLAAVFAAPIAPLAIILAIIGVATIIYGATKYQRNISQDALNKLTEVYKPERAMLAEAESIKLACASQLENQNYNINAAVKRPGRVDPSRIVGVAGPSAASSFRSVKMLVRTSDTTASADLDTDSPMTRLGGASPRAEEPLLGGDAKVATGLRR